MARQKQAMTPATGIGPSWMNVYASGLHGFKGRHFFNPVTGEALSVRQGQRVQRKQLTLEQALDIESTPMSRLRTSSVGPKLPGSGKQYARREFRTLYGAFRFASQKTPRSSLIAAYGKPSKYYPEYPYKETGSEQLAWRTLLTTANPSGHRFRSAFAYYREFDRVLQVPQGKENPRYSVMEVL